MKAPALRQPFCRRSLWRVEPLSACPWGAWASWELQESTCRSMEDTFVSKEFDIPMKPSSPSVPDSEDGNGATPALRPSRPKSSRREVPGSVVCGWPCAPVGAHVFGVCATKVKMALWLTRRANALGQQKQSGLSGILRALQTSIIKYKSSNINRQSLSSSILY